MVSDVKCKKKSDKAAPDNVNHRAAIIKPINKMSMKYSTWRVFEDFLGMAALSISNSVDWTHREEREAQYMEIVGRYERSEVDIFPQMLAHLIEELERHADEPQDVLGKIFHELELHNKYKGQFFTPQHICDFMGMCALSENDPDITRKGYITLAEPCCGSGTMVLGFSKAMKRNGYDPHRQMLVTATDVDIKCVHMCYLQLSLYGIPAVVIHGNTITMKEFSRWYTPVYMLDGWVWRQAVEDIEKLTPDDETTKQGEDQNNNAIREIEALTERSRPVKDDSPVEVITAISSDSEQLKMDTAFDSLAVIKKNNSERKTRKVFLNSEISNEQISLFG